MAYTIQALRLLRTEFFRAAKKWTTPRACWFHQAYQEPLDMVQHCKQVRTFLDTISHSAEAADIIVANENGRHYTVALLDGTPEQNTFFRRLAVQASTTIREDKQFLLCHLEKLAPGFQSDKSLVEKSGSARYMPWIALAAALRLKQRDIRLQVEVRYCVPGGCVPARWQYHEPAGLDGKKYNLPMETISIHATGDGIFRFPNTYQGPPFSLWGFTHDVWRVSVAAMDKLIEAAEQSAEGIEPTATDADAPSRSNRLPATTANEDRDKWLYEQCLNVTNRYSAIIRRLAKKKRWAAITSVKGVTQAANRYAKRYKLPPIPSRQPGRTPKKG